MSTDDTNMDSLKAYSHYLAMKGQLIGLTTFDGHEQSVEERELQNEICRVSDKLVKILQYCPANEIANLTGYYSILYTIGYRNMPASSILDKQRDRLVLSWKSGDKTIEESDVYGILLDSTHNPMRPMPPTYQQILNGMRENWIRTLEKYNTFPDSNTYERYSRLALIVRDNIDSCSRKESVSAKKWFIKNKIDNLSSVGTKILTSYRQFVNSLFPAVLSSKEMRKLEVGILKELVTRNDLNDYDQQGYQMALTLDSN